MLECRSVTVEFGRLKAVDDVSITVPLDRITSIIGANGAGKTTLLRTISGLEKAKSGRIIFNGVDIANRDPSDIVRCGVSHVPAGFQLFKNLTVRENLRLGAYVYGSDHQQSMREQLEFVRELFPILQERESQAAGTLSGGQQQMVAIARALMARPKLLLLDEPSLGLAPLIVEDILRALGKLNREHGLGILLVEQNATLALDFATHAYLLEGGVLVESGPTGLLRSSPLVMQAYLGL
jgi:branched-chain amino acid transport system ATP-binding protein